MSKVFNKNKVSEEFNKLISTQQNISDKISALGRERDLKVNLINKDYQAKIDEYTRQLTAITMQVNMARQFVKNIACSDVASTFASNNFKDEE